MEAEIRDMLEKEVRDQPRATTADEVDRWIRSSRERTP